MLSDDMLVMRLPGEVKVALRRVAKTQGSSMSSVVVGILSSWLQSKGLLKAKAAPKRKAAPKARAKSRR